MSRYSWEVRTPKPKAAPKLAPRGCEGCPLNCPGIRKVRRLKFVTGRKAMVWGMAPGFDESTHGKELIGRSGKFLWGMAKIFGLSRDDFDVQNVVRCRPTKMILDWHGNKKLVDREPSKVEAHHCSIFTEEALLRNGGKAIVHLVLGQFAAKTLLGKEFRKDHPVFWSQKLQARVICVAHPAYFLRGGDRARLEEFKAGLKAVKEAISGQKTSRFSYIEKQDYTHATRWRDAESMLKEVEDAGLRRVRLSVDVEYGTVQGKRVMLTIGISPKIGSSRVFHIDHPEKPAPKSERDKLVSRIKEIFENKAIRKSFHHGTSDLDALKKLLQIKVGGYDFDTNYSEYLAFSSRRAFGLTEIAHARFPEFAGYKEIIEPYIANGNYADIPKNIMRLYNGADCDISKRIEMTTKSQINPELQRVYKDAGFIVDAMEKRGPLLDYTWYDRLMAVLPSHVDNLRERIRVLAGNPDLNPNSTQKIAIHMYDVLKLPLVVYNKYGLPVRSTGKEALDLLSDSHEFPRLVKEFRRFSKMCTTYLPNYKGSADLHAGELRTQWWLCMPATELVMTDRGYLPVNKVRVNDLVMTHKGRPQKVTSVVDNGIKPILQVTLTNGMVLRTTPNHEYLCSGRWIPADKLKPGKQVTVYGDAEVWAKLTEYPFFSVSSWGRVRNDKTRRILHQKRKSVYGHLTANVTTDEPPIYPPKIVRDARGRIVDVIGSGKPAKWVAVPVSRLVAMAHLPTVRYPEVRHLNGYAWDNTKGNLKWGTRQENASDAAGHGSACKNPLVTQAVINYVRSQKYRRGSDTRLAKQFNVSRETIGDIRLGRCHTVPVVGKVVKFSTSRVVSVVPLIQRRTFGISVETDCSHITGGIVTHNTGTITGRMRSGGGKQGKQQGIINMQNLHGSPLLQNLLVSDAEWRDVLKYVKVFDVPDPKGIQPSVKVARLLKKPDKALDEKYVFMALDYSQAELRMLAHMSKDARLIKQFKSGVDIHSLVVHDLVGWPIQEVLENKEKRTLGKNIHFGVVFGLSENGLVDYAKAKGAKLADQVIIGAYRKYFELYTGVKKFIDRMKKLGDTQGYVETIFGFRRDISKVSEDRGSFWGNQSINSPIQGGAHQLMVMVMAILKHKPKTYNLLASSLIAEIHDAFVWRVKVKDLPAAYLQAKELMEHAVLTYVKDHFKIDYLVPLVSDAVVGFRNGTMTKYKGGPTAEWIRAWAMKNSEVDDTITKELQRLAAASASHPLKRAASRAIMTKVTA